MVTLYTKRHGSTKVFILTDNGVKGNQAAIFFTVLSRQLHVSSGNSFVRRAVIIDMVRRGQTAIFFAVLSGQFCMSVHLCVAFIRRARPHIVEYLVDRIFKFFGFFARPAHVAGALVVYIVGQVGMTIVMGRNLT